MARNINRMVWANGFTNDKSHFSNQEAYDKSCSKCGDSIRVTPTKDGWKALDVLGRLHKCGNADRKKKRRRR